MKHDGIRGMFFLLCFSGLAYAMLSWGGYWAVTAKVLIAILTAVLGISGVRLMLRAADRKVNHCYICGTEATRHCDFLMVDDATCERYACHLHMRVAGKRDYCVDHYDQEGLRNGI